MSWGSLRPLALGPFGPVHVCTWFPYGLSCLPVPEPPGCLLSGMKVSESLTQLTSEEGGHLRAPPDGILKPQHLPVHAKAGSPEYASQAGACAGSGSLPVLLLVQAQSAWEDALILTSSSFPERTYLPAWPTSGELVDP